MIELIEETGTLFPYLGGSSLISSFFADDVLFFCKASIDQARVVNLVLHEFCRAFGLKVNLDILLNFFFLFLLVISFIFLITLPSYLFNIKMHVSYMFLIFFHNITLFHLFSKLIFVLCIKIYHVFLYYVRCLFNVIFL